MEGGERRQRRLDSGDNSHTHAHTHKHTLTHSPCCTPALPPNGQPQTHSGRVGSPTSSDRMIAQPRQHETNAHAKPPMILQFCKKKEFALHCLSAAVGGVMTVEGDRGWYCRGCERRAPPAAAAKAQPTANWAHSSARKVKAVPPARWARTATTAAWTIRRAAARAASATGAAGRGTGGGSSSSRRRRARGRVP